VKDELRPLWNFGDLDASEARFAERLDAEQDDGARAELLTQLARVDGLRGNFEAGEARLREAEALASESERAGIRIDLERGRLRNSSGDPGSALPLFVRATERAEEQGELFIAADAAHMAAIAAPDRDDRLAWTRRGIEIAESGEGGRYWVGPLLNNLGWDQLEAGEHEAALASFEQALDHRLGDPENGEAIALGRYAVAKAQQSLGRHAEAAEQLELAVAWTDAEGAPDGWYHEALAESAAALGREEEARLNAELALELLPDADPSFADDHGRVGRLRELAGASQHGPAQHGPA
jgi:tetratricopeptide (TPR) repeat protein